jgi:hypothetical protein
MARKLFVISFIVLVMRIPLAGLTSSQTDYPLFEEFNSSDVFTSTDPDIYIQDGKVHWTIHNSEGYQFLYRNIPAFEGNVRITVTGQVDWASNNCDARVGIGKGLAPQENVSVTFGYSGGGCPVQGYRINARGVAMNLQSDGCSEIDSLWVSPGTQYTAKLTITNTVNLDVIGVGSLTGIPIYADKYDTLFVGFPGPGDWPSCRGSIERVVIEPLEIINQPPIANAAGPYLVAVEQSIALDGSGSSDPDEDLLSESWVVTGDALGTIAGSTFNAGTLAGITEVTITVEDGRGGAATDTAKVVVYDPYGGYVTGGGWIMSLEETNSPDPTLTGKATFGFVSKYKKGATVPTGNTEFQFKAGELNFHSSEYEWLLVTGNESAKFKGTGTINGEGQYKFQIWAGDSFDEGTDTFRIKIWEEDAFGNETVIYDNASDQPIGGGNIVVHTK